ncbi:MAG TPA: hypothetical protein VF427_14795, partial [Noviherbaspirillum sp.]
VSVMQPAFRMRRLSVPSGLGDSALSLALLGALMERADVAVLAFFIALALAVVAAVFIIPYP